LADRSMGIDLVPLARYAWSTPWVWRPLQVVYGSIPLMLAIAWTAEKSLIMRRAVVIAAVSGYFFYMLVPACGPQYAFPGFPWAEIHGSGLVSVSTLYARNCFPSLHFSWALLLLINARSNWLRAIMCCFTILTALGTVLGGEHYVIDLIAAVPFVIGVQAVSKRWPCMVAARRVPAWRPVPSDC
ncbi:MAG: phosphatase PAP2 family protein, partial [Candidatus Korobacteraceae bacterium]